MKQQFTRRQSARRLGITLLELVIAGSMLAVVATSISVVMRTCRTVWETNDNEYGTLRQAHAVTTHFVRQARECVRVNSISTSGDSISLSLRDGGTLTWRWAATEPSGLSNCVLVRFSNQASESPVAANISNLLFTGYEADGVTTTKTPEDIRLIKIAVTVAIPTQVGGSGVVVSNVWVRTW